MSRVSVYAPDGLPEVRSGDDLAALILPQVELTDGLILVVTSKIVSKAEGRVLEGTREEMLEGETQRVVARRGPTTIVRTAHGLTMAAAGIDASNVEPGRVVLLPEDPDASARHLRRRIADLTGVNVAVVITDTAGRAWREGQTDIAIGAAGLKVLIDHAGEVDSHGNPLAVTAPAVADEIAGMAELAQGKLTARPFAVVTGRRDLVLPPDQDGPGAVALVRPEGSDLFGYGSREAVIRAVRGAQEDQQAFGAAVSQAELDEAFAAAGVDPQEAGAAGAVSAIAFAHGWEPDPASSADRVRLRPRTP
ncbi:hypothetical protein GCM10027020_03000 [Nocardioides salsibiostraticola]